MAIATPIALGNNNANSASPNITNLEVSGDDRIIICGIETEGVGRTVDSLFYDDGAGGDQQSFTQLGTYQIFDEGNRISFWYLVAPNTGAGRRIIGTLSSATPWFIAAVYTTGAAQSSTFTTPTQAQDRTSPGADTDTSDTDGSWQMAVVFSLGTPFAISSGGVERQQWLTGTALGGICDSNSAINAPSSNTLNYTYGSVPACWISAMMRPVAGGAETKLLTLMGVGT